MTFPQRLRPALLVPLFALISGMTPAQTPLVPTQYAVAGNLSGVSTGSTDLIQARFNLVNCGGAMPTVPGVTVTVATSTVFTAESNGTITGVIWGNDSIQCNGVSSSLYQVTYLRNNIPAGLPNYYRIAGTFDVTTAVPVTVLPPTTPLANGIMCPTGEILLGILPGFQPVCENVPTAIGPAGPPGATLGVIGPTGPAGPALTPYQYPAQNSVGINRDLNMNGRVTPFDFGAVGLGTAEQGDECEATLRAVQSTSAPNSPTYNATVDLGDHTVRCTKANALINLPADGGDYLSTSSGAGAAVDINFVNGAATSCSVYGGGGYNPNATLMVSTLDTTHQGSGAVVEVLTNSSGVPSSCVVMLKGMHYPSGGGLVQNTVFPAGADGATATIALTSGTFASTWTATTGGNGYTTAPAVGVPVGAPNVVCTSYPFMTATISGTTVTGGTSSTGSGCTFNGNATATVPVCIGACMNGVQATNLPPEVPTQIGCAIPIFAGTKITNGSIIVDRPSGGTDTGEIVAVCDPWGDQGQSISITKMRFGSMIDVYFAGKTQDVVVRENVFGAQPYMFVTNYTTSYGSALGVFAPQMGSGTDISDNEFLGNAGIVCGGVWTSRTGGHGGLGSLGGVDVSLKTTTAAGGSCDGLTTHRNTIFATRGTLTSSSRGIFMPLDPLDTNKTSVNPNQDVFFETYFWKTQNSPTANIYAPNGTGACPITTTVSRRQVDWNFGNVAALGATDPFFPCYRGVSMTGLLALSRYGYASQVHVSDFTTDLAMYRPLVLGSFANSTFVNVAAGVGGRQATDPYTGLNIGEALVSSENSVAAIPNTFLNVTADSSVLFTHLISSNTLGTLDLSGDFWAGVTPTTGQKAYGTPSVTYTSTLTPVSVAADVCADQTYTVTGLLTTDTIQTFLPPATLGNFPLPLATISAANTLKLHWCNITAAAAVPPSGTYTTQIIH